MVTRALGKALGRVCCRLSFCGRPGPHEESADRPGRVATSLFAAALWIGCTGSTGDPDADVAALPEFDEIAPVSARKARFFDYLTPIIRRENDRIRDQRARLTKTAAAIGADAAPSAAETAFLHELARNYRLDPDDLPLQDLIDALLLRVDVIPRSLVLVQAAKESAWGRSRFARGANNLFGQHCFHHGCGIVPRHRPAGANHEVQSFDSVRESVASYMRNLNTHDSYRDFRTLRAEMRASGLPLSGIRLAEGLTPYSERGDVYVQEVRSMIRQNDLETSDVAATLTGS